MNQQMNLMLNPDLAERYANMVEACQSKGIIIHIWPYYHIKYFQREENYDNSIIYF